MQLIVVFHGYVFIPVIPPCDSTLPSVEKSLELALSYSQTLSQWAYLILAGSVALLVKDFPNRPKSEWFRRVHCLFVPGWVCLFWSIQQGMRVQGAHISYAMGYSKADDAINNVNDFASCQQHLMLAGLCVFGLWLLCVLWLWMRKDAPEVSDDVC